MKIFVTGGTGFIGSYVLQAALAANHLPTALSRDLPNRAGMDSCHQPRWCNGDLQSLRKVDFEGIETVIHLASAGVSPKKASWDELIETNVAGSLHLLQIAAAAGVQRFVIAGTCHEYGYSGARFSSIPPDAPLEPASAYGASKAAAFHLLHCLAKERGLELFYGRIFSVYGPGQFEGNFWPSMRRAALSGEDFPMTSGRQVSDFVPVELVASHLLTACTRTDLIAGQPLVVNIGTGQPCSLLTFAEREWRRFQASGKLLPGQIPDRVDQIYQYVPDLVGLTPPASVIPSSGVTT